MTDWTPFRPRQEKPRTPAERLWSLVKENARYDAELRDWGELGAELQLLRDGELLKGRRFDTRAIAILESQALKERLQVGGWVESS